jgi:hypothetical protein
VTRQAWYQRIKRRRGSKIARVAVMRRTATIMWRMLSTGEPWRPGNPGSETPPAASDPRQAHQSWDRRTVLSALLASEASWRCHGVMRAGDQQGRCCHTNRVTMQDTFPTACIESFPRYTVHTDQSWTVSIASS